MEQLVILLLIALISIINWIIQKSKEARAKRKLEKRADATGEPVARQEPAPDVAETAMRRLREALGLPEDAPPPALPKRAEPSSEPEKVEPKRRKPKRFEPPISAPQPSPDRLPPPPLPQPETRPVVVHVPPAPRRVEHRRFEFPHKFAKPSAPEAPKEPPRIRELLQSQGGLRDAVVLSEILGLPKSLRENSRPS
jgi:outer membrane biosynthesis protein TonB